MKIQEKLETVIPVVESGYVNSLLFQKEMAAAGYYQQLLDIEYGQGYVMVVQFGQSYENGRLVSRSDWNVEEQELLSGISGCGEVCFSLCGWKYYVQPYPCGSAL